MFLPHTAYNFLLASYCSMVFDWMITVVSPRLMLEEVVVMVRVTLQLVSTVASPMITSATIVVIIFRIKDFMS